MDEFEAIAHYALRDLDLPDELREEIAKRLALVLFWDRRLTFSFMQQKLRRLGVDIENAIAPTNGYGNYLIGSDIDRIRREFKEREGEQCQTSND